MEKDVEIISEALEGIDSILTVGQGEDDNEMGRKFDYLGGFTKLENLQTHQNKYLANKAIKLIEDFYVNEEMA